MLWCQPQGPRSCDILHFTKIYFIKPQILKLWLSRNLYTFVVASFFPKCRQMNHDDPKPKSFGEHQADSFARLSKHRLTNTSCCSHARGLKEAQCGGTVRHRDTSLFCQMNTAVAIKQTNSFESPTQTTCFTISLISQHSRAHPHLWWLCFRSCETTSCHSLREMVTFTPAAEFKRWRGKTRVCPAA